MNEFTLSRRGMMTVCSLLVSAATGCSAPTSYSKALMDVDKLAKLMAITEPRQTSGVSHPSKAGQGAEYEVPPEGGETNAPFMELPRLKARFCIQRAIEDYQSSKASTGADMAMLLLAGIGGGIGTTMGAASAAMPDTYDQKRDLGIASVSLLAAGGAVLGLRTALNLHEVGRVQRIAAARSVNAAIAILEKYALTDDPKAVGEDGFGTCRDEDVNIANAFPGAGAAAAIEQVIAKAKESEKQASADAAAAKATVKEATGLAASSRAKADDQKQKVEGIRTEVASMADKRTLVAERSRKEGELEKAERDLERLDEDARKKEAEALRAKVDSAKADLAAAQAELGSARAGVIQAGGMLRRAVFYLTAKDVELAKGALEATLADVDAKKVRVASLQKDLDVLRATSVEEPQLKDPTK